MKIDILHRGKSEGFWNIQSHVNFNVDINQQTKLIFGLIFFIPVWKIWGMIKGHNVCEMPTEEQIQKSCFIGGISLLKYFFFFFFFAFSMATPTAYGSSQARDKIGNTAASLCRSYSNFESKLYLWPTPQLMAILDPQHTE